MAARVLDGRAVAAAIRAELGDEVERLAAAGRRPTLAAVLVGDDEASHIYVGSKQRAAGRSGIGSRRVELPADAAQKDVLAAVAEPAPTTASTASWSSCPCRRAGPGRGPGRHRPGQGRRRAASGERGTAAARRPPVRPLHRHRDRRAAAPRAGPGRGQPRGHRRPGPAGRPAPGRAAVGQGAGGNATVTLCHTGTRACPGSPGRPTCSWRRRAGRP